MLFPETKNIISIAFLTTTLVTISNNNSPFEDVVTMKEAVYSVY